jgi:hypothetical protein
VTNPELKFHLHLRGTEELAEILEKVMRENDGCCMDDAEDRMLLVRAIVEELSGEPWAWEKK